MHFVFHHAKVVRNRESATSFHDFEQIASGIIFIGERNIDLFEPLDSILFDHSINAVFVVDR